ncbi:MAG TPA: hypothetical protein VFC46_03470, partial [Humisphaera sp.]|nr:hypothetical protein [Humisphaera sp.]
MIASQARRVGVVCILFLGLATASAPAAGRPAPAPGTVEAAVAQLEAEANDAFRPEGKLQITVVRPHAAVAKLSTSTVRDVLRLMNTRLTGDPLKDTYIRYHLMYLVNKAQDEGAEHFTRDLIALAGLVPKDLKIEFKQWLRYEPPEVAQRYYFLVNSCIVNVGFPPFNRQIGAPASFQYMDAAQKAKCTAMWAEAQTLVGKFKAINSAENYAYNWRQIYMNWIIREYRGELLYDLVAQDDPRALERIIDAIVAAAASDPVRATDFASFLNKAYFDGMLGKHSAGELKSVAKKLRAAALASEIAAHNAGMKTQGAKGGPTMSSGWVNGGGRWRQVPESLFTVVFGIENDRVPAPVEVAKRIRPADNSPPPAPRLKPVTPETINLEMIDSAIARGVTGLEKLRPPDVDLNHVS